MDAGRTRSLRGTTSPSLTSLVAGSNNTPPSIPLPSYLATLNTSTMASGSQTFLSSSCSTSNLSSTRRVPQPDIESQGPNTVQMPPGAFVLLGVSKSYN